MTTQIRLTLVFALGLILVSVATVWKGRELLLEDKLAATSDSIGKQSIVLRRVTQLKVEALKSELVGLTSAHEGGRTGNLAGSSNFDAMALMLPVDSGSWSERWVEMAPQPKPGRWKEGLLSTLLQSLPYSKVIDGHAHWVRLSDASTQPLFAILVPVEVEVKSLTSGLPSTLPDATAAAPVADQKRKAVAVGFVEGVPLAVAMDELVGSSTAAMVVDDKGYLAAHSNKTYWGALFSEDPLVQEIVKEQKTSGQGYFEDLDSQSILAHYERVDGANLTVVVSARTAPVRQAADAFARTTSQVLLGGGFILLALVFWMLGRLSNESSATPLESSLVGSTPAPSPSPAPSLPLAPLPKMVETSPVSAPLGADPFTLGLSTASIEGLCRSLRESVVAVLAESQLLSGKAESSDLKTHAQHITEEARRARTILEKATEWLHPDVDVKSTSGLRESIESTLKLLASAIESGDVQVKVEVAPTLGWRMGRGSLQQILSEILIMSLSSLRGRDQRQILIRAEEKLGRVRLTVEDTGLGLTPDLKELVFEPFVVNREAEGRLALGYSLSNRLVKRHGGTLIVESSVGVGTTVHVEVEAAPPIAIPEPPVAIEETASEAYPEKPAVPPPAGMTPPPPVEELAGKSALGTQSFKLPPPPPGFSGDLEKTESSIRTSSSRRAPPPPPPTLAADDDENFAPMGLKDLAATNFPPAPPPPVSEESNSAPPFADEETSVESSGDGGFVVRIRQPKRRS